MHRAEHLFSNFGCFSVADAVVAAVGEGCSTDAVLAVAVSATVHMQHLRSSWWAMMSDISSAEGDASESE